jgi:hypothetical protein
MALMLNSDYTVDLNGSTNPIFKSPDHQAEGKLIRLTIPKVQPQFNELWRNVIPKPQPKPSLWHRFKSWLNPQPLKFTPLPQNYSVTNDETESDELNAYLPFQLAIYLRIFLPTLFLHR